MLSSQTVYDLVNTALPCMILYPRSVQHVENAMALVTSSGLGWSVRGGAHNAVGTSKPDNGIIIDMKMFRSVAYNPETQIVELGAGVPLVKAYVVLGGQQPPRKLNGGMYPRASLEFEGWIRKPNRNLNPEP